jgi:hypothetical protein
MRNAIAEQRFLRMMGELVNGGVSKCRFYVFPTLSQKNYIYIINF